MISSKTSNDLFNKIRSKFGNIQIGNPMGEATANPGDAVFFDFDFSEDGDSFGRVSISIADGESVKVFYNQGLVNKIDEESRTEWYSFLKELKDFAVTHQLGFDVRDITKSNLTQQDYKNIADTNQTVNTDGMSEELNRITKLAGLAEGLTGTARSSFENLDKTRLIIRHSKAVDENIPGDRTRNINSLYIENQDGERFKYPVIHLAGARAMARHVANGGVPHDDFGKHIVGVSEQIAQLNSFSRYAANKDQLNDSAGDIIEKAKLKLETMRKYIKGLSKQKNYEAVKETFQPTETPDLDDATKASLREKFTLKHMDDRVESALPLLHNIMQEYDQPEDEIADPEMDAPLSAKDAEIPTPVDAAPMVQQFLSDPENKLVLRKDDTADAMLKRTKFTTKNGMLSSILSDIASRMLTKTPEQDRVANFASAIANDIGREGTPFFEPTKDYIANKKIAFQLAKRYVDDYKKMQQDPEYAGQVRQDPAEFGNPKKDRQGRAKEDVAAQFESWANRVVENDEPMIIDGKEVDPSSIEYDMQDYGDVIAPISAAKFIDGTDLTDDQMADLEASEAYITWVRNDYNDRAMSMADDVNQNTETEVPAQEGNEFALAVQKAKAAGMKPGDKFEVGGKEYTLKDAIEQAGLQLEEFFSEAEGDKYFDYENSDKYADNVEKYGDVDKTPLTPQERQQFAKWLIDSANYYFEKALEGVDEIGNDPYDLDDEQIKLLPKVKEFLKQSHAKGNLDQFSDDVLDADNKFGDEDLLTNDDGYQTAVQFSQHARNYTAGLSKLKSKGQDYTVKTIRGVLDLIDDDPHVASAMLVFQDDFKGTPLQKKVSRVQASESVAEAKPDFLDMDKDGDKTEPMKKAIKDKEAKEDTELTAIKKLAGI